MNKSIENTNFVCENCKRAVRPLTNGSFRNHCPYCLYSKHLDEKLGDRSSDCRGIMEPVKIVIHSKKGLQIVHKCLKCGIKRTNKTADDIIQPDNMELIFKIIKNDIKIF